MVLDIALKFKFQKEYYVTNLYAVNTEFGIMMKYWLDYFEYNKDLKINFWKRHVITF